MTRPTLIDLNFIELNHYPFIVSLDKFRGSCNAIDDLSTKIWKYAFPVKQKTKILKYLTFFWIGWGLKSNLPPCRKKLISKKIACPIAFLDFFVSKIYFFIIPENFKWYLEVFWTCCTFVRAGWNKIFWLFFMHPIGIVKNLLIFTWSW